MRRKKWIIFGIACFALMGMCALILLQSVGVAPPVGVGWGDGARARAYSIELNGSTVFRVASGMKPAPPGSYAYGVESLGRSEGLGISHHRWNMTAGRTPQAPVLGTFTEVRIAPAWPILFSLILVTLWMSLLIRQRRAARSDRRCINCGYDLRATPERCPECGLVPAAPHVA